MEAGTFPSPQSHPVAPSPLPLSPDPAEGRPAEALVPLPMADLEPAAEPAVEAEEAVPAAAKAAPEVAALEISAATPPEADAGAEGRPGPAGLPPPPPAPPKPLKTALSRATGAEGGARLSASKRTVSWADLTSQGTLTQVKEYQPESAPGSPLSDTSWEADHASKGCCTLM